MSKKVKFDGECKETNPKDAISSSKLPLSLFPATAIAMGSIAFLNGMLKYGKTNWRAVGVRCSVYLDACKRHIQWFEEGEWADEEGVPHLASAMACLAIITDSMYAGKLHDDRVIGGGYKRLVKDLIPIVDQLRKRHKDKHPRHYMISDTLEFGAKSNDSGR